MPTGSSSSSSSVAVTAGAATVASGVTSTAGCPCGRKKNHQSSAAMASAPRIHQSQLRFCSWGGGGAVGRGGGGGGGGGVGLSASGRGTVAAATGAGGAAAAATGAAASAAASRPRRAETSGASRVLISKADFWSRAIVVLLPRSVEHPRRQVALYRESGRTVSGSGATSSHRPGSIRPIQYPQCPQSTDRHLDRSTPRRRRAHPRTREPIRPVAGLRYPARNRLGLFVIDPLLPNCESPLVDLASRPARNDGEKTRFLPHHIVLRAPNAAA